MTDPWKKAMFKRSSHNNFSIIIINQSYYPLPKRTIRANGCIYYIFKPNFFRDIQNRCQDKSVMDMTLNENKLLTSACWND